MININVSKEELLSKLNIELNKHGMAIESLDEVDTLLFEMPSKDKICVSAIFPEDDVDVEVCMDNMSKADSHTYEIECSASMIRGRVKYIVTSDRKLTDDEVFNKVIDGYAVEKETKVSIIVTKLGNEVLLEPVEIKKIS